MKGPVGEVMEVMTVGTAVEISSGMHTRMSQSVHTCVYVSNRVGPEPALLDCYGYCRMNKLDHF